jgi:flavorubredoxin
VYWVGAIDWDRRLFDSLIPLPEGTSYNAYLVTGTEKTVLLDTVDPSKTGTLLQAMEGVSKLDYVVVHHVEQDHSGSLPVILTRHPEAKVLCSPEAVELLRSHLHVSPEKLQAVEDNEVLELGGKTLRFLHTPWVHWPETMCSYLEEDGVLFSCDLFGSHLATSDLFADESEVFTPAKRYYAEIMMPFRAAVRKNLDKVAVLVPAVVAPSHGPLYARPDFIFDAYRQWVDGPPKNVVVLPYVSMHGSTLALVERLAALLIERGIKVERFDLTGADLGRLAASLVDAATLVVATPTVLTNPHPLAVSALYLISSLRPPLKHLSLIVSYGWATNAVETATTLTGGLKAELIPPVVVKGLPTEQDLQLVEELAAAVATRHKDLGLAS